MASDTQSLNSNGRDTMSGTTSTGDVKNVRVDDNGQLLVGGFTAGDIEIGAVEIKDGTSDTRASVLTTTPAFADPAMATRETSQNFGVVVLASGALTTTQTQADQTNRRHKGLHLVVDVTNAGTGSITPKIQGKDANGVYYDLLVGTAITTVGTNVLKLYPGLTPVANAVAGDVLPLTWRVVVTANNANSVTYSVAAQVLI